MKHSLRNHQRGGATLIVTVMLFLAMALAAFAVNRHLVFEQRSAANQARATQAFEAAEAGLEWGQAQLNSTQRIDATCQPSTDPSARTFRERMLSIDRGTGMVTVAALRPSCVRTAGGWSCSCPIDGPATPSAPNSTEPAPAFALQFQAGARAGDDNVVLIAPYRTVVGRNGGGGSASERGGEQKRHQAGPLWFCDSRSLSCTNAIATHSH